MKYLFQPILFVLVMIVCCVHADSMHKQSTMTSFNEQYFSSGIAIKSDSIQPESGWYISSGHMASGLQNNQATHQYDQMSNVLALALIRAQLTTEQFQEFCRQQHIHVYGVSKELLHIVSDYDLPRLEEWIMSNMQLSRSQALNIWDAACKTKWLQRALKGKGRSNLEITFDRRECEARQKVQELKEAQEKQTQLETEKIAKLTSPTFDPSDCHCLPRTSENISKLYQPFEIIASMQHGGDGSVDDQNRWHDRVQAFEQTKRQDYQQYEKSYQLTLHAQGYLAAQNLQACDYQALNGTTLQHQLHSEVCNLVEQVAQQQKTLPYQSCLLNRAIYFADASCQANNLEWVELTLQLHDVGDIYSRTHKKICNIVPDYLLAAAQGVVQSGVEFVHIITHPGEIASALTMIVHSLGEMSMAYECESMMSSDSINRQLVRQEQLNKVKQEIENQVVDWYQKSTGPQRFQAAVKFGSDFYVPGKIIHALGSVIGIVRSQVKVVQTLEDAIAMLPEGFGVSRIFDEVAESAQKLEFATQENIAQEVLAQLMEAEAQASKVMPTVVTRSIVDVLTEIKMLGGKIPLSNPRLMKEVEQIMIQLLEKVNCGIDPKFRKLYAAKNHMCGKINKRTTLDITHIVNYSFEIVEKESEGRFIMMLKGGHLGGSLEALEATGAIKILNKKPGHGGCFEYSVQDAFTGFEFTKTEFPTHWDCKKIIESCWDIYENPNSIELSTRESKKIIKEGIVDNCKIQLVVKKYELTENIITAYPLLERSNI